MVTGDPGYQVVEVEHGRGRPYWEDVLAKLKVGDAIQTDPTYFRFVRAAVYRSNASGEVQFKTRKQADGSLVVWRVR